MLDSDSDLRYFNKVMNDANGKRDQRFAVAFSQTINRSRYGGALALVHGVVRRILEHHEIEGLRQGPYFSIANALTALAAKGGSVASMKAAIQKGNRLDEEVLGHIAAIFYVE